MEKKRKDKFQKGEAIITAVLGICVALGAFAYTNLKLPGDKIWKFNISGDKKINNEEIILPTFASKEELLEKVKLNSDNGLFTGFGEVFNSAVDFVGMPESTISSDNTSVSESNGLKDYSTTNTQVQGVDEADIIKTNGDYIYYISRGNLYIFDTKTLNTKLVKTIKVSGENNYYTQELYIDDNYITVITQENVNRKEIVFNCENEEKSSVIENAKESINDIMKPYYYNDTTVTAMYVYDIDSYELVKKTKTEGFYVSSRKIDNSIYLVTNKNIYSYGINEENILPIYSVENGNTETYFEIPAQKIKYFSEEALKENCSYMIITSLNLSNIDNEVEIDTYLGAGTEIYSSKENLYVTKINYNYRSYGNIAISDDLSTTQIHKFKLLDDGVKYVATGKVSGALLNQYSMDEYNDYFRITTTSNSGNSLYVLNEKLEEVGKLENLARGERIYATRFMGDKCYLVTYKTVDPLFVIDLSVPEKPTVLGELKIPGYSTYLHPLGENYLIGFGEDSVEKGYINWEGEQEVTAYNVGLKLAIFDITDLNNPKEIHSVKIGGRGSYTELLNNPKVLYFDEEEKIFAFPATLTEETKFYQNGTPMYGEVIFEGALVYNLSVENGISFSGKIEHDFKKDEKHYNSNNIERIISIGENFYTLSPNMLKVTNIETMQEIKEGCVKF